MDQVEEYFPFAVLKMAFHSGPNQGLQKEATAAGRDDDLAM
jgi:hypothetical protein